MDKVFVVKANINDFEGAYDKVLGVFTEPGLAETFKSGYEKKMLEFKNSQFPAHLADRPSDEWTVEEHIAYDKWLQQHDMGCEFKRIWVDGDTILLNPDLEKFFL